MRRGTSLARCADAQRPNDSQIGPQGCRATLNVRLKFGSGAPFRRPEVSAQGPRLASQLKNSSGIGLSTLENIGIDPQLARVRAGNDALPVLGCGPAPF